MVWIRLVLVLSLIAIGVFLILGNPGFLPITILGVQTSPLPLWMLLLGAILLGFLTGTVLQRILDLKPLSFQTTVRRPSSKQKKSRRPQQTPKSNTARSKHPTSKNPKSKTANKQNGRSASASRRSGVSGTDWDDPLPQDWFDRPAKGSAKEYDSRNAQDDYYERSIPRPASRPASSASDRIVDADYRVLTPPYTAPPPYNAPPPTPRRSNDEWDDEFFDDD